MNIRTLGQVKENFYKNSWTKTTEGRNVCGRWKVDRTGESNGGKLRQL